MFLWLKMKKWQHNMINFFYENPENMFFQHFQEIVICKQISFIITNFVQLFITQN